jgi:hypothetical protein
LKHSPLTSSVLQLAHSAVGGVGFGVGANIVNQIFN